MAQSIHADPLAGLCMVGGSSRVQHQVFVSLRELVLFFASLLPLGSACLTSVHSNKPDGSGTNSSAGKRRLEKQILRPNRSVVPNRRSVLVDCVDTIPFQPQLTWMEHRQCIQIVSRPNSRYRSSPKIQFLGCLIGSAYFIQQLHACWEHSRNSHEKRGYQPGIPQSAPQPIAVSLPTTTPPNNGLPPQQYYSAGVSITNSTYTHPLPPPPALPMVRQ